MISGPTTPVLDPDRFELRRRVGSGGFGDVFEALDRLREAVVAVKVLHRLDAKGLYRFKQEFRSLSDIAHDNLITLYELLSHAGHWYFTMEFVEGGTILDYVRNAPTGIAADAATPNSLSDVPTETVDVGRPESSRVVVPPRSGAVPLPPGNLDRLRDAVRGLASGLSAIHRHGIVHHDVKPGNVMVTPAGRVVLLDFGLAKNVSIEVTASVGVSGTPAYMSPEQAAGQPLSEAADWYAVGVVMYEALTGALPHSGPLLELLAAKQIDPPPPSTLAPGVPPDLEALCMDLLTRDPAARPGAEEVLRRLGGVARPPRRSTPALAPKHKARLIGRDQHLEALHAAFRASQEGRAVAVMVEGRSGMGKSALVGELIRDLSAGQLKPVILQGRCYERETMPYKAVDSLIDALARHLKALSDVDAARLLPRDIHSLARLFPVLHEVRVIAQTPVRAGEQVDINETRRRAFVALRGLLGALADESPLVAYIDDIQWGDLDSVGLLRELLRPPTPPNMLLIVAFRSEARDTSPVVRELLQAFGDLGTAQDVRTVEVGELSTVEAIELALSRFGSDDADGRRRAEAIARESGGSPFFVDELVRYAEAGGEHVQLDEVIRERVLNLPEPARQLLRLVSVSSRPLARDVVLLAAGSQGRHHATLDLLRVEHLVKSHTAASRLEVEPYHDRIREVTLAGLTPDELAGCHRALIAAWEQDGHADPGTLTTHYHAVGDRAMTAHHAARAAEDAERGLAFERAAYFYRLILSLDVLPPDAARETRARLAEALANDGRGHEAGVEFLALAAGQPAAAAVKFELRAAEQFLMGGSLDAGLDTTDLVLGRVGMKLASTPLGAIASVLGRRAILKIRGFKFKERHESQVPADQLQRLDVCSFLGGPLGMVEPLRGFDLQVRQTLLALKAGEPHRIGRAMSNQIANFAIAGSKERAFTQKLVQDALALADRLGDRAVLGRILVAAGMAAKMNQELTESLRYLERAFETLGNLPGFSWERQTARIFMLDDLMWLGRWVELFDQLPGFIEAARQRGDLYASSYMRSRYAPLGFLIADDAEGARAEADRGMGGWSTRGYSLQRYYQLYSSVQASIYRGDAPAAWDQLEGSWPTLKKTIMRSIQSVRVPLYELRGRVALAVVADSGSPAHLKIAGASARALRRERVGWADAYAARLEGAMLAWRGDRSRALEGLAAGDAGCERTEMAGFLAAGRRRRGEYTGGDEGRQLIEAADAWFATQRVRNPASLARCFAPSLPKH
jgi:serine/threonine protein kinase